jgi:hypothetical protein
VKIPRLLLPLLQESLLPGKVVALYGPRQVGKTTLALDLIERSPYRARYISADELLYREALASQNRQTLGELLGDAELLVIDEAQRVPNIGLNLMEVPHAPLHPIPHPDPDPQASSSPRACPRKGADRRPQTADRRPPPRLPTIRPATIRPPPPPKPPSPNPPSNPSA